MRGSVTVCRVSLTTMPPRLSGPQCRPILIGEFGVGADARGHHHQVGRDLHAVLELHGHHAAVLVADQLLRLGADHELEPAVFERLLQQLARHVVELALHQPGHDVHHRDLHAAQHQAVGGLQAQQAAADHHGVLVLFSRLDHGVGVGDVAVGDHALQVLAGHRQDEGLAAGGDQQAVVLGLAAVVGLHHAAAPVDIDHLAAELEVDAVFGIPAQRVQHDLVERLFTGQHGREQDAVVVGVGLGAEHRDVVQLGGDLQQLFERAHAGHAVADHHQFHLLHVTTFHARGARWWVRKHQEPTALQAGPHGAGAGRVVTPGVAYARGVPG